MSEAQAEKAEQDESSEQTAQPEDADEGLVWADPQLTRYDAISEVCNTVGVRTPRKSTSATLPKRAMNGAIAYLTGSFEVEPRDLNRAGVAEWVPDKPQMRAAVDATARGIIAADGVWQASRVERPLQNHELNRLVAALRLSEDQRGWLDRMHQKGVTADE